MFLIPNVSASQPEVTLHPVDSDLEIDTQDDQSASVRGFVRCDTRGFGQNVQKIIVNLDAQVDHDDWGASAFPVTMIFEPLGPSEQNFEANVVAPQHESASKTSQLTISGIAMVQPGGVTYDVEPIYAVITIKPFMLCISEGVTNKDCEAGDVLDFGITINNFGNYDETFQVQTGEGFGGATANWVVTFSDERINVNEKSKGDFEITVKVPDSADKGTYSIPITILSQATEEQVQPTEVAHFELYITVDYEILGMGFGSFMLFIILLVVILLTVVWKRKFILNNIKTKSK
jgi:hypothetical protein